MKKKGIVFLLILAMMLSVFAACSPADDETSGDDPAPTEDTGDGDQDAASGEPSGQLIVGMLEASGNYNPLYYSATYDANAVKLVFQKLITLDEEGVEYQPQVAESWEISEDEKSITFKMREDIVFSDGEPLTAHDVVFTYTVIADPSYTGRYGKYVQDMKGYKEYYEGETDTFEGVEALNDYEVQFNFEEPMRVNLTSCAWWILPEHHYGADFKPGDTSSVENITTDALGSGPYKVEKFVPEELAHLTRNENYADDGYMIKDILMKFVDQTTDIVELTSGEVDLLDGVIDPDKIAQARDGGFEMNIYPRSGYGYVKTNHESGPTAEKEVRQALYYAFNMEEFVNSYFLDEESGEVVASTQQHPFSQVSWAVDDALVEELNDYEFDLDKANELLDEAGWEKNDDGIREKDGEILQLNVAGMPDHDILNTLIPMWERDWGQGLGIELNIEYLEFNTLVDYVKTKSDENVDKWSLFFMATSIDEADPHEMYDFFHSSQIGNGRDNELRYRNDEVDKLFDEGKVIFDVEEAKPIYKEIVKILNEEAVMMPVYANTYHDIYSDKLVDFETSSFWNWTEALKDARVVE